MNENDTQEELVEVFNIFDKDGDDRISQRDLYATLKEMGETVTEADVREMIDEHGGGLGYLTFESFWMIWAFKSSNFRNDQKFAK